MVFTEHAKRKASLNEGQRRRDEFLGAAKC